VIALFFVWAWRGRHSIRKIGNNETSETNES
jgi:hypothetical protein